MKKRIRRRHLLELDDREINQQRVWERGDEVEESRWVSLDPDDVASQARPGWLEKSRVEGPSRPLRAAGEDDACAHSGWRRLAVVMCGLGGASMALLPVLLNVYLGGWRVQPQVWAALGVLVVVVAGLIAVVSGRGSWRWFGGLFVAVMVCVAMVCAGLFSAEILGLTD